ncbi:MSHA biogenesis protein MshQ [Marinobacter nauticus]|uniref:MSHA biogenesis protein MshQ n=1 Tax=Marinobacter nauticus TaxID=2743 RepID=A0A368USU0_MARNT|nr:MSHA biogenesis protein MshQ [Marinobacter nauticus]RCW31866.1 MSHA biogenesis protein MshQ [Marinobacter nauticus]
MNRTMSRTFMNTQSLLLLALLFSLVPLSLQAQQVVEFDSPGNGSFTVPANVRSITVEVWGGGGSGGSVSRPLFGGGVEAGGGGGGAYASRSFGVSVGQTFAYRVGSGGSNSAAGDSSWFGSPSTLLAQGGAGVSTNNTSGGAGGRAVSSVGDAAFSGGRGANARGDGGGGGGSAGSGSAGNDGAGSTGGSAVAGGGAGGNGSSGGSGAPGSVPGGGGGGAACSFLVCLSANGGAGASGRVRITYTVEDPKPAICFSEEFSGGALNTDDWATSVSRGSFRPGIVGGRLRLTEAVGNQATAVSLQRLFPGADNLIQVEFDYYAYDGNGADGVAIVFSDASITPQAGGYGGSLGYAQEPDRTGGFAGGWLGIGIDEYGNYSNWSEGRQGGKRGRTPDSVAVRGAADLDYQYIAGSDTLSPGIDATGRNAPHRYRITIDSRGALPVLLVERDTTATGTDYQEIISVTLTGQQAVVPENLFFSLTGSTGGSTNIHELDGLEICADEVGEIQRRVDHFEIIHSGSGLTCKPETVRIRACDDPACNAFFPDPVEVTLSPSGWVGGDTFTMTGETTRSLAITSPGTVTLGVPSSDPGTVAFSQTLCDDGSGTLAVGQCEMTFFDSGFDITVPDHIADTVVTANIAAVRKDDSSQRCVPGFDEETKDIALWSSYINPSSGSQSVILDEDGSELPSSITGTRSLFFDANGLATVSIRYPDVGRIRLNARYQGSGDDAGLEMLGDGEFVARPDHFQLTIPGNPAATSVQDDNAFVAAGDDFEVRVSSVNASGNVTPNFGRETPAEDVVLEASLEAPSGGDSPALSGSFGDFGQDCNGAAAAAGAACGQFQWPEVGIISITPELASGGYLGTADVIGNAVSHVGRFIPDRFGVTITEPGEIEAYCDISTAFSYIGKPFEWLSGAEPTLLVEALNVGGAVTRNYTLGDFQRLSPSSLVRTPAAADNSGLDANGVPFPVSTSLANPTLSVIGRGQLQYRFSSSDEITYDKTVQTRVAPFTPDYSIELTQLQDADSVTAPLLPTNLSPVMNFELRYGRLQLENVYGPETVNLAMPLQIDHYTAAGFTRNLADSCWGYNTGSVTLDQSGLSGGSTSVVPVSETMDMGGSATGSEVVLAAPGEPNRGDVRVSFPVPVWLQGDYDGDGSLGDPSGVATFGVYRGHDRIIYWREVTE